ncbi:MAG: carbohydrate kinase family protein [Deltaproteobacteria bacterium]|jgi:adenosine kinase|nr:carbohydrate kinase family protein [Deltaproteobacteria bacterium]
MSVICSGSLAFDRISYFPGYFKDYIMAENLSFLNLSFLVDRVERAHGGTAGNIVYNLFLLREKPWLVSAVGRDHDGQDYLERLRSWDLDLTQVGISEEPTSGAYVATDKGNNQLSFFHPGAMLDESPFDPQSLPGPVESHLAIVSPGSLADMRNLCRRYRELGLRFIFDPGQQVPAFSGPELLEMLDGSLTLITNEYEIELFLRRTGTTLDDLFQYTTTVVTTLGSEGSRLITPRGSQHIMPGPAEVVVNPTGAGDAYRAGLLKALAHKEEMITACRLGSTVASFCVEKGGPQEHHFTPGEVMARHFRTFRETINCLA